MGRRNLKTNVAWDDVSDAVLYTAVAVKLAGEDGDKEVGATHTSLEKQLKKWEDLDAERRSRRSDVVSAHALVKRRSNSIAVVITDLHNATLTDCKLNRKAALFVRLFPKPLSSLVRLSLESQVGVARTVLLKLGESETPAALRKAHEKPLTDAMKVGEAALKRREEALVASGQLAARIGAFRDEVNQTLLGVEGALTQIAAKRGLTTSFVDAFFPAPKPASKKPSPPSPTG